MKRRRFGLWSAQSYESSSYVILLFLQMQCETRVCRLTDTHKNVEHKDPIKEWNGKKRQRICFKRNYDVNKGKQKTENEIIIIIH